MLYDLLGKGYEKSRYCREDAIAAKAYCVEKHKHHDIDIVVDYLRFRIRHEYERCARARSEALELALKNGRAW